MQTCGGAEFVVLGPPRELPRSLVYMDYLVVSNNELALTNGRTTGPAVPGLQCVRTESDGQLTSRRSCAQVLLSRWKRTAMWYEFGHGKNGGAFILPVLLQRTS